MSTLIYDDFTGSNGTTLDGRTPPVTVSSRTWDLWSAFNGNALGNATIQGNAAAFDGSDDAIVIDAGVSNFKAIWYMTTPASGQFRGGLRFRLSTATSAVNADYDYYFATCRFDLASAQLRFIRVTNNSETVLNDTNMSFSYNTTYKFELVASGSTFTLFVDGVQKYQVTDSNHTGTFVGIGSGAVSGNNLTFDSIEIQTLNVDGTYSESGAAGSVSSSAANQIAATLSSTGEASILSAEAVNSIVGSLTGVAEGESLSANAITLISSSLSASGDPGVLEALAALLAAGGMVAVGSDGSLSGALSVYVIGQSSLNGNNGTFSATAVVLGGGDVVEAETADVAVSQLLITHKLITSTIRTGARKATINRHFMKTQKVIT